MKVTSYTQLNIYEVAGNDLAIYWNEQAHSPKEDETEPYWTYDHCQAFASDSWDVLVEKIIATKYPTYGAEVALINNKDTDPGAYAKYQAFRTQAKALADGWVKRD